MPNGDFPPRADQLAKLDDSQLVSRLITEAARGNEMFNAKTIAAYRTEVLRRLDQQTRR